MGCGFHFLRLRQTALRGAPAAVQASGVLPGEALWRSRSMAGARV